MDSDFPAAANGDGDAVERVLDCERETERTLAGAHAEAARIAAGSRAREDAIRKRANAVIERMNVTVDKRVNAEIARLRKDFADSEATLASEPRRLWRRYLYEGPAIFWIWWRWRFSGARSASGSDSIPPDAM